MTTDERDFSGAKIILHREGALLTYLRDDIPSIPFPALWDLPGGGVEGSETPMECALRETFEEFGIHIPQTRITWSRKYKSISHAGTDNWFFAASISQAEIEAIVFGDEGQFWRVMPISDYIVHRQAVPHLQRQVRDYLAEET